MSSSSDDFFPIPIEPKKKPQRPEPVNDDWSDDNYDEKCINCGQIYAYHTPNQALFCAKLIVKNSLGENYVLL
ncbi:MAG: hypothetical protein HY476_00835 [Nitrosarchaeum sp.]|nr:hypothetical protein [Nitrosarchaeum sp.]